MIMNKKGCQMVEIIFIETPEPFDERPNNEHGNLFRKEV